MVDSQEALQKAKDVCPLDSSVPEYCSVLYLLLRCQDVPFKRAVQLTLSEMRHLVNGRIDYHDLYDIQSDFTDNGEARQLLKKIKIIPQERIEGIMRKASQVPHSPLGHFIWTEFAIVPNNEKRKERRTVDECLSRIQVLNRQLVDTRRE